MDIKEKFKSFIDKQIAQKSSRVPSNAAALLAGCENWNSSDLENHVAVLTYQSRRNNESSDDCLLEDTLGKEAQDVVIETIDPLYFEINQPDVGSHELQKFPDIGDVHVINGIRSRLRKQQSIVSRRVSDLIFAKQDECMAEIEKIDKLQKEACLAVALCVETRKKLLIGKKFASESLQVVANHRKRGRIVEVLNYLKTIRTLQMTDVQLQKLLKAEDYPGAIQLLSECQAAASNFKQFTCISELSSKLQNTLIQAEQQLDSALNRLLVNFNRITYSKIYSAYTLLNKRQTLIDQLHFHFTSHIHNFSFTIVLGYVELYNSTLNSSSSMQNINSMYNCSLHIDSFCSSVENTQSSYSKMQYSELCKYVNSEYFLTCYLDLCRFMFRLLRNYKEILRWHEHDNLHDDSLNDDFKDNFDLEKFSKTELVDQLSYVDQKLKHGLLRIWQDVQAKIRTFILASDLSQFHFDDFLKVLDLTNCLMKLGELFCGSQSEPLKEAVRRQSTNFFRHKHAAKLDELRMFLENEVWQVVPVKPNFTVYKLIEFRFLRVKENGSERSLSSLCSPVKNQDNIWLLDDSTSPFDKFSSTGGEDKTVDEDILASADAGEELFSDEDTDEEEEVLDEEMADDDLSLGHLKHRPCVRRCTELAKMPVMTNTTLTVLRVVGKYLRMMKLLEPIACDVFTCLTQLIHYYLYTICHTFGIRERCLGAESSRVLGLLQRIEGDVVAASVSQLINDSAESTTTAKVPQAEASSFVTSHTPSSKEGVAMRVAACESFALLLRELQALKDTAISALLPQFAHNRLTLFFKTLSDALPDVMISVYGCVGVSALPSKHIIRRMSAVNWNINCLESQHSAYVDEIVSYMNEFAQLLQLVSSEQPLPKMSERALWEAVVNELHCTLLLGLAEAKICSNEGRSLMLLDYQQLTLIVEPLSGLRPLPGRSHVEGFIKAFYLPEAALREWLQQHRLEYSPRALCALIAVMSHVPKHARTTLQQTLEAVPD